jgi:hypothetical protein
MVLSLRLIRYIHQVLSLTVTHFVALVLSCPLVRSDVLVL